MVKILFLLAGGAIGTGLRYMVSGWAQRQFESLFPYGTLAVNMIGSFLIGLGWGMIENSNVPAYIRTFVFVGIFGGFTTFSSYTLETLNLMREGEWKLALGNVLLGNILGLFLVFAGFVMARSLFRSN